MPPTKPKYTGIASVWLVYDDSQNYISSGLSLERYRVEA